MKQLLTNLDGYEKLEDYLYNMVSIEDKFKLLRGFEEHINYSLNFMFIHREGMYEAFIIPTNLHIHEIRKLFNIDLNNDLITIYL